MYLGTSVAKWSEKTGCSLPEVEHRSLQRAWDEPLYKKSKTYVLESSSADPNNVARLLVVSTLEAGAWLRALPVVSIGNLLDDASLRIAISLRLGAPVTVPHKCTCGSLVDPRGYHGLSCRFSAGRRPRHAGLNAILKRALTSAGIPSQLEPIGISRSDGKRPDGVTLIPWSHGKCLCWDATVVCTMAASHIAGSITQAGSASGVAEKKRPGSMYPSRTTITLSPWASKPSVLGAWRPKNSSPQSKPSSQMSQKNPEPPPS